MVWVVELPDAQMFVPVNETLILQRRKAETFDEFGKVIVRVNREMVNEPEVLMKKFFATPLETVLE
jgi:hypothetical protein